MIFGIKKKNFYKLANFKFRLIFRLILLTFIVTVWTISIQTLGSSNINDNIETSPIVTKIEFNKIEELTFKTPTKQITDNTKLEYKSTIKLPDNNSWAAITQPESSSEPTARIIKKNDKTFISILESNLYPKNTSKIVFDIIDIIDVNQNFYRIPNIKTPATNDYTYIDKKNTIINYKPDQEEIKNFNKEKTNIIFFKKQDNQYVEELPEDKNYQLAMIQEKNGENNWSFSKHQVIGVTADNNQDLLEADQIIKNSKFDNQGYALNEPINTAKNPSNSQPNNTSNDQNNQNPTANPNVLPYVITLGSFGLINLIIRQYFTR